jgi:peptidoglycan/xylan/chitin deacetylase (PgdA/CDA1 family)
MAADAPFRVALTFDAEHPDRPTRPGVADGLLETLASAGARTTWFLQGRWVEAHPDVARRVVGGGHLVGNHSFYHARMPLLSASGLATDVRAAERVIVAATHAVFSDPAVQRMQDEAIDEVVVTDTIPLPEDKLFPGLTVLPIAPLLARAIHEVFVDGSVTSMFDGAA